MRTFRVGEKSLRLLVLSAMLAVLLCGCGNGKYAPVETLEAVENTAVTSETVAFTIGETDSVQEAESVQAEAESEDSDKERISYEEGHDWVIVTADVLNVRAEDHTNARIYVQLKTGDILERNPCAR